MSNLITNKNIASATSVNTNDNITNIALGNKILFDVGIINTIILGSWNRLVAGSSTVIQLGTKMSATIANSINVTKGDSWHYSSQRKTISRIDYRTAIFNLELSAGATIEEHLRIGSDQEQANLIIRSTIIAFLFTIGVSLPSIQFPAFKTSVNKNDSTTNDPSTGEIIDTGSNSIKPTQTVYLMISDAFSILMVLIGQWILTSKMTEKYKILSPVSRLLLNREVLRAHTTCNSNSEQHHPHAALMMQHIPQKTDRMHLVSANKSEYSFLEFKKTQVRILTENTHGKRANIYLSSNWKPDFIGNTETSKLDKTVDELVTQIGNTGVDTTLLENTFNDSNYNNSDFSKESCHILIENTSTISTYHQPQKINNYIYMNLQDTIIFNDNEVLILFETSNNDLIMFTDEPFTNNQLNPAIELSNIESDHDSRNDSEETEEDIISEKSGDELSSNSSSIINEDISHNNEVQNLKLSALKSTNNFICLTTGIKNIHNGLSIEDNGIHILSENKNLIHFDSINNRVRLMKDAVLLKNDQFKAGELQISSNNDRKKTADLLSIKPINMKLKKIRSIINDNFGRTQKQIRGEI